MEAEEIDDRMDEDRDDDELPRSDEEVGEGVNSEEHDSSEESEDDPEEAKRIAEGFIVDDSRDRSDKHKKRKKKKKHRKHRERDDHHISEDEELDEDDLDLLEQNQGGRGRLIRKGGRPGEPTEEPAVPSLENIFGTEAVRRFDQDDDDLDDFIEDDDDDAGPSQRPRASGAGGEGRGPRRSGFSRAAAGLSNEAWEEIQAIFGTGNDYEWAMELDEEAEKPNLKLQDIYEPSQIAERMMTKADEAIRSLDKPERLQLATAALAAARDEDSVEDMTAAIIPPEDLDAAAEWVAPRISDDLSASFLVNFEGGIEHPLRSAFVSAVRTALQQICTQLMEPPFVWLQRRDYFVHFDPNNPNPAFQYQDLLGRTHLWVIQTLGIKYRAFCDRRAALRTLWNSLHEEHDQAFEDAFAGLEEVEQVADLAEWVNTRYMREIQQLKAVQQEDEMAEPTDVQKKAVRESRYSRIRNSAVYRLATEFGPPPFEIGRDYAEGTRRFFADDPNAQPLPYASFYVDPSNPFANSPETALESAKFAVVHELASLVPLRKAVRRMFKEHALISVRPTDQGISSIDEYHVYYSFKYLNNKPVRDLKNTSTFIYILDAERNGDVTIEIKLPEKDTDDFMADLSRVYLSDFNSADAQAWNDLRRELLRTAIDKHLLPLGAKYLREWLREESELVVAVRCAKELVKRTDAGAYRTRGMSEDETPGVVAISHGHGDPKKDSVWVVYLDENGRVREHFNVDNLRPTAQPRNPDGDEYRARLTELLIKHRPQVVVMGGFTPTTHRLTQDVLTIVQDAVPKIVQEIKDDKDDDDDPVYANEEAARTAATIDTIYVNDEVARIYQHSSRAQAEFSELPATGKYCVALARYVQNPVIEYAALGKDILALTFDTAQKFISESLLMTHLERAIVNSVNAQGVDINRAVREPYYAFLLPYVAGLGPRKAQSLIDKINAMGGTLPSRAALVVRSIMGNTVFINCAAFLRIDHEDLPKKLLNTAGNDAPDILDSTRIHPEDYDIARKMAADAEELDEEDLADLNHPSQVVSKLLDDDPKKLDELSLDDFAVELQRLLGTPKRLTLYLIRDELKAPYKDQRPPLVKLDAPSVFSQLTGETRQTLELGLIIPVMVVRLIGEKKIVVRLDSGVEGTIEYGFFDPPMDIPLHQMYQPGQTIRAVVSNLAMDTFTVNLDLRAAQLMAGDAVYRRVARDPLWDDNQEQIDIARVEAVKKKQANRAYRTIQHPYFHNYNSRQAEDYLERQPNGECVVRPSGRGTDHLAVTWKVAQDLYQHLDILEMDKPSEFELGSKLKVMGTDSSYADIDELVVSHIKGMSRKVEEMLIHEKCKGSEEDTVRFLKTQQRANPNQSLYAFALDRRNPGQFVLMFLTNKATEPRRWPVKVLPGTFQLGTALCPDVMSVCNAFKTQYVAALSNKVAPQAGGRTPYGAAANAGQYGNYGQQYGQPPPNYGQQYGGYQQQPPPMMGNSQYNGYGYR